MRIREMYTSDGHIVHDTDYYEPFTNNKEQLFRSLQKEHGRCVSKMYIDKREDAFLDTIQPQTEKQRYTAIEIGWVFQKRAKYQDCDDTYLQETWVEVRPEL